MRATRTAAIAALLLGAAVSGAASAHHSFAAMYDSKKPVRIVGKLSKVQWTNPHSTFELDVKGADGRTTAWVCEGAGPGALSRRGFDQTDIKVGNTLIVDGYLARSGEKVMDARRITLPNGRVVSGGSAGDGGPQVAPTPAAAPR